MYKASYLDAPCNQRTSINYLKFIYSDALRFISSVHICIYFIGKRPCIWCDMMDFLFYYQIIASFCLIISTFFKVKLENVKYGKVGTARSLRECPTEMFFGLSLLSLSFSFIYIWIRFKINCYVTVSLTAKKFSQSYT